MAHRALAATLFLAALAAPPAPAAPPRAPAAVSGVLPSDQPPALREQVLVHRVRWPALAAAPSFDPDACARLAPGDLVVVEGGRPGRVESIDSERNQTLFVFLVDVSRSMETRLAAVRAATRAFAASLAPRDEVAVYVFDDALALKTPPTRDPALVDAALASAEPGNIFTALYDALDELMARVAARPGRTVVILVSDGEENASRRVRPRALLERAARSRGVRFFAVVAASAENVRCTGPLRMLAAATAGNVALASDETALGARLAELHAQLDREVMVTYAPPTESASADRPRRLRVKLRERLGVSCRVREAIADRLPLPPAPDLP